MTVGPLLKEMLNLFHVDHLFVGTDGFAAETGFMGKDMMRSEVVRYMSGVADKTIILTDSSKFQKTSLVNQLSIEKVYGVITDKDLDPNISRFLTEKGIQLTFV